MLPAEREQKIIAYLTKYKTATVHTLATEFNVHDATIRRDLVKLEQYNQIRRTHGGVVLNNENVYSELNFDDRQTSYYYEKLGIGYKAAEFVDDGDTLIIDSGSTTLLFAKAILQKQNLTIITNDIHIASILRSSNHKVIVTGGTLYHNNYVLNGLITTQTLQSFNSMKAFLATPAMDALKGVTHYSEEFVDAKRQMVYQSKEVYMLTDSSKLNKVAFYQVCPTNKITTLITDNHEDLQEYKKVIPNVIAINPSDYQ
ncbi:DeoR/GlpR family DNA-binding transcription regulator [Staphylococcus pasteuri]|uniref:DeoR/GlpR family DNA-binding transcription regulator n=1 Tax=Staphylococcus pasteuri TaxID=45972 RepID=UPI000D3B6C36|nr:DeoR/GlpR family DNA-binding transcription regulator [Staphylococcus pasteuri]MCT1926031.1 DeoR/GlpR family DNA-binding transcription regulator [Staphylococcus pasteuri]MEB6612358.1 DeoR/GlpR family DNA-binding transcription regulator [Staphylococcus pasteuri]MEB7434455.1 DeoR/GlpR family DNA-binding transcription regulator [Staphylococcus pasteuri]PTU87458.1 DeoR/GlpR transcriptional regulator [Staphylococcus pasteuri]QQN53874.1 DeoR/GlpR transcriptional regulator [Staphylococcus pasteuri]